MPKCVSHQQYFYKEQATQRVGNALFPLVKWDSTYKKHSCNKRMMVIVITIKPYERTISKLAKTAYHHTNKGYSYTAITTYANPNSTKGHSFADEPIDQWCMEHNIIEQRFMAQDTVCNILISAI